MYYLPNLCQGVVIEIRSSKQLTDRVGYECGWKMRSMYHHSVQNPPSYRESCCHRRQQHSEQTIARTWIDLFALKSSNEHLSLLVSYHLQQTFMHVACFIPFEGPDWPPVLLNIVWLYPSSPCKKKLSVIKVCSKCFIAKREKREKEREKEEKGKNMKCFLFWVAL